jgi:omega-6 fatty acid desaturase (delta-12 desaturase)
MTFHDMGHRSFFTTPFLNRLVGTFVGVCVLSPFSYWADGHAYHHAHSNDLDYDQHSQTAPFTVAQYMAFPAWKRAAYRVICIPMILMGAMGPFALCILQPFGAYVAAEWAVQLTFWGFLHYFGLLHRLFLGFSLAAIVGVLLFHLQHTFETTHRCRGKSHYENGLFGSSYLHVPWFLRYFTASIEVHHIHHLSAQVPLYKLQRCHDEAPEGMFDCVRRMTFSDGLESMKYVLYDEELDRLVTFAEVDAKINKVA